MGNDVSAMIAVMQAATPGGHGCDERRRVRRAASVLLLGCALGGCSAAPSRNILGSYFPSWMICALAGLALATLVRVVLVKTGIDDELPAPIVVYVAVAVAFSFALWLVWLR